MASGQQAEAQPAGGHPSIETLWPNWIGRETTNLEIGGSSPSRVGKHLSSVGLVGYDVRLTRGRSPVRSWVGVLLGSLAQMVEHWSNKPRVMGSIPIGTILLRPQTGSKLLWCNG